MSSLAVPRLLNIVLIDNDALHVAQNVLYSVFVCSKDHSQLFSPIMDFPHPQRHVEQSGTKDLAGPSWMFFPHSVIIIDISANLGANAGAAVWEKKEKGLLALKESQGLDKNVMTDGQCLNQTQHSLIS